MPLKIPPFTPAPIQPTSAEPFSTFVQQTPLAQTPLSGTELVPIIQGGQSRHTPQSVIAPTFAHRTILTANTNYYVTTTGSDANDGSLAHPWATLQHALFFIANSLDIAGFTVFVNLGAGSFAGAGVASTIGGGIIQINGAGSSSTTLTDGPNDGVINDGTVFSMIVLCGSVIGLNKVTLKSPTGGNIDIELVNYSSFILGDAVTFTAIGDVVFDSSAASSDGQIGIFAQTNTTVLTTGGSYAIKGTNWNSAGVLNQPAFGFTSITDSSFFQPRGTWTISNSPTMNFCAAQQSATVNLGTITVTGAFTGNYVVSYLNSVIREANSPSGSNPVVADVSSVLSFVTQGGVDGIQGPFPYPNTQTGANYNITIGDNGGRIEMNNVGANTVTIPTNATLVGSATPLEKFVFTVVQIGAGATTIQGAGGVTVHNAGAVGGQWKSQAVYWRATDEWVQINA